MTFKPEKREKANKYTVFVRFHIDTFSWVEQLADDTGVSNGEIVRQCVEYARNHMEDEK